MNDHGQMAVPLTRDDRDAEAPERVVERSEEATVLRSRLANGAQVIWTLDSKTLQTRRAAVLAPDGRRIAIQYRDYREAGKTALPGAVKFLDPSARTSCSNSVTYRSSALL